MAVIALLGISCAAPKDCPFTQVDIFNCGSCGHICPSPPPGQSVAWCALAECGFRLSVSDDPFEIISDGTSVFWVDLQGDTVRSVAVGGGVTSTIATNQVAPANLNWRNSSVYWSVASEVVLDNLTSVMGPAAIVGAPERGGPLVTITTDEFLVEDLVVDDSNAYWLDSGGFLLSVPLNGGMQTTLASGLTSALGLAIDATGLYWINAAATGAPGSIQKWSFASGGPFPLQTNLPNPWDRLALDSSHVYWIDNGIERNGASVHAMSLDGENAQVIAQGLGSPYDLVTEGDALYWVDGRSVLRLPLGGSPAVISPPGLDPGGIATDRAHLYWTDVDGPGGVYQFPLL